MINYPETEHEERRKKILIRTCENLSIKVGSFVLPQLLSDKNNTSKLDEEILCNLDVKTCSGRIFIDLNNQEIQIEKTYGVEQYETSLYKLLGWPSPSPRMVQKWGLPPVNLSDVITALAKMCTYRNLESIQLFNLDLLYENMAFDDTTAFEILEEKIEESTKYNRVMIIIDLESLCGVTEHRMGESINHSLLEQKYWRWCLKKAVESRIITHEKERWVVVVSSHQYITEQFKMVAAFPLSSRELDRIEQTKEDAEEKTCARCKQTYTEKGQQFDSCTFHFGPLMKPGGEITINPEKVEEEITRLNKKKENGQWYCCGRDHRDPGCQKGRHVQIWRYYGATKQWDNYRLKLQEQQNKL